MTPTKMNEAQIHEYVETYGLNDDMYFTLHKAYREQRELLRKAALTLNNRRAFEEAAEIHKALEQ